MDLGGPWLAPLQPAAQAAWAAWQTGASVAAALNGLCHNAAAWPQLAAGRLRFVPQTQLPAGEAYEAFIHRTALVPTRDNPHDFFNGLVWLARPALKARLNALQAGAIAQQGSRGPRGALRDALTVFDESGALLQAPPALCTALRAGDWRALFVRHRPLWAQAQLLVVGHALLEKLASAPRKPLTAQVLLTDGGPGDALALDATAWAAKPLHPLPVLGVPGWWSANAVPEFYDDLAVFRPPSPSAGQAVVGEPREAAG